MVRQTVVALFQPPEQEGMVLLEPSHVNALPFIGRAVTAIWTLLLMFPIRLLWSPGKQNYTGA